MQIGVWLALVVLYVGFDQGRNPEHPLPRLVLRSAVWGAVGFFVSSGIIGGYRRVAAKRWSIGLSAALGIVVSLLASLAWLWLFDVIDAVFDIDGERVPFLRWERQKLYFEWMDHSLMLLVWHGVLFSVVQFHHSLEDQRRAGVLEQRATEAQLLALRAQLNPHFLFNALNTAMALVHENPEHAEIVLQKLSDVLRASLSKTGPSIPLSEELALLRDYLSVENMRFEEQLQVTWDTDADGRLQIPPGLLLPLVENAVKHGFRNPDQPLGIVIGSKRDGETLELFVENDGEITASARINSLGVGLDNVKEQVAARFGDAGSFSLISKSGRVTATITLPLTDES